MNEITLQDCSAQVFRVSEQAADCISPQWQNWAASKFLATNHKHCRLLG